MFKRVKNFFLHLPYLFFFGMKSGNNLLLKESNDNDKINIIQEEDEINLGKSLMKGEVSQQVEELRYGMYQVEKEAKKYKYIGNGVAVKVNDGNRRKDKYTFTQDNRPICESVTHELNRVNEYGEDRYTFQFVYKDVTRFKLERYINFGKFKVECKQIKIDFYFDKTNKTIYDSVSYAIHKELDKISKFTSSYEIENNDICSNPIILSFITYKANGEDDIVSYIINDMKYASCSSNDMYFVLSFYSDNFERKDLTAQYYSKTMDEKYKTKAEKTTNFNLNQGEREEYCEICGEKMNTYDADLTKYEFGKCICQKCLKKYF